MSNKVQKFINENFGQFREINIENERLEENDLI